MKSCGVIVEYNPFHHGHAYHVQEAKKISGADTMIAVMSGNFLQRGEPAIIDKFHRTKAALSSGVDLVLELPYAFAVQHSDYFAKGAVQILHEIGVSSICFGSESGNALDFKTTYEQFIQKQEKYEENLRLRLDDGMSYPDASMHAYSKIGLTNGKLDLSEPNNILGLGYVKAILDNGLSIDIHTIKRINNHFHESVISNSIASATSIRKEILRSNRLTKKSDVTMPEVTKEILKTYQQKAGLWHEWEKYFQLMNYRVQTMDLKELKEIHGVSEGLENRLKQTAKQALGMNEWIHLVKSKRYTWARIQRLFTHLLTNTTKEEIKPFLQEETPPYIRILGMTKQGQKYLNFIKKQVGVPLVQKFSRKMHPMLQLEERATSAYYSILPAQYRMKLVSQELRGAIRK